MRDIESQKLLDAVIATGASEAVRTHCEKKTYQVNHNTSSGSGAATVKVQVSNDNSLWIDLATFTLTLSATPNAEGATSDAVWKWTRFNVTSISGTDATISAYIGMEV